MIRAALICLLLPLAVSAAEPSVPELIKQLSDRDAGARVLAAEALGRMGPDAADAAPKLAAMLHAPRITEDRLFAAGIAKSIAKYGTHPFAALRIAAEYAVRRERNDDEQFVFEAVERAINQIGPKSLPAMAAAYRDLRAKGMGLDTVEDRYGMNLSVFEIYRVVPDDCVEAIEPLMQMLSDPAPKFRLRAIELLARFGPRAEPAIPELVKLLSDSYAEDRWTPRKGVLEFSEGSQTYSSIKGAAARALAKAGPKGLAALERDGLPLLLNELDRPSKAHQRRAVASALMQLGQQAKSALPKLREIADRRQRQGESIGDIAAIFSAIGEPALPTMRELLKQSDKEFRHQLLISLPASGKLQQWAVQLLHDEWTTAEVRTKANVLRQLNNLDSPPKELIDDLIPMLKIDPFAKEGKSRLRADVEDHSLLAADVLQKVGEPAVRPLAKLLDDKRQPQKARFRAVQILGKMGAPAKAALPQLRRTMFDGSLGVSCWSMYACVRIDGDAKALAFLIQMLETENPDARRYVVFVLGKLGGKALAAEDPLIDLLNDDSRDVRQAAAEALENLGSRAKNAPDALKAYLMKHPGEWEPDRSSNLADAPASRPRQSLVNEIKSLDGRAQIMKELETSSNSMYLWDDLAELGPQAKIFLPSALAVLRKTTSSFDRQRVANFIARIGPDAKDTVPELVRLLQSANSSPRQSALEALAAIGPNAKVAVPDIKRALRDPAPSVRLTAALALNRITGDREIVFETFKPYLGASEWLPAGFFPNRVGGKLALIDEFVGRDEKAIPILIKAIESATGGYESEALAIRLIRKHPGKMGALVSRFSIPRAGGYGGYDAIYNLNVLGAIGPEAKNALPDIEKLRDDLDPKIANAAEAAIRRIKGD